VNCTVLKLTLEFVTSKTLLSTGFHSSILYLIFSVAQIIGLVIRKTIYQLHFAYRYRIGIMTEEVADTDICIYLEIHAHVHQVMFKNA